MRLRAAVLTAGLLVWCAGQVPAQECCVPPPAPPVDVCAPPPVACVPVAAQYGALMQAALMVSFNSVPQWQPLAEQAAKRLVDGGGLYVGGSMPGFDIEALGRAGGLCMTQRLTDKTPPKAGDVVFYGILRYGLVGDAEVVAKLVQQGTEVVVFGTADSSAAQAATGVVDIAIDPVTSTNAFGVPMDGVLNVANLWAFSAEVVSACTRLGKMPTMYQSVMLPGSRERNAMYRKEPFHTDLKVPPIPAGQLGRLYLAHLQRHLNWICRPEGLRDLAAAADLALTAKRGKHTAWVWLFGHWPPYVAGNPGDPGLWKTFTGAVKPETVGKELQKGDVLLHVGYTSMEPDIVKAARGAGAKVISIVAGTPSAPPEEYKLADLWLDPHWVLGDAELPIDGYDVRILPPSGTINIAMYWMITAEMVACGG